MNKGDLVIEKKRLFRNFINSSEAIFFMYVPLSICFLVMLNLHKFMTPDWLPAHDSLFQFTKFLYIISAFQNGELPLWNSYLYGGAQPFYLLMNNALALNPIMWICMAFGTLFKLSHTGIFIFCSLTEIVFFALGGMLLIRELIKDNFIAVVAFIILLFCGDANYWSNQYYSFVLIEYVPWVLFFMIKYFRNQTTSNWILCSIIVCICCSIYYPCYLIAFLITAGILVLTIRFDLVADVNYHKLIMHFFTGIPVMIILLLPLYLDYHEITHDQYQLGRQGKNDKKITYEDRLPGEFAVSKGDVKRIFPGMFKVLQGYNESVPLIGMLAFIFMLRGFELFSRNSFFWYSLLFLMCLNYFAWSTPYHYLSFYLMPFYKIIRSYGFFSGFITLVATILACRGLGNMMHKYSQRSAGASRIGYWKTEIILCIIYVVLSGLYLPGRDRLVSLAVFMVLALFVLVNHRKIWSVLNQYKHLLAASFIVIGAFNLYTINGFSYQNDRAAIFNNTSGFGFAFTRPDDYTYKHPPKNVEMPYDNLLCCITNYHLAEKKDGPWFFFCNETALNRPVNTGLIMPEGWKRHHTTFIDKGYFRISGIKGFDRLMKEKLHFFRYYTVMNDKRFQNIGDFEPYLRKSVLPLEDDGKIGFRTARVEADTVENRNDVHTILPAAPALIMKGANRVSFSVEVPEDMFLLYTDLYHKGFRVFTDGVEKSLLRGMGVFKAVELRKGKHIVEFQFRPTYFYVFLLYLAISVGFFIFMSVVAMRSIASGARSSISNYRQGMV